MKNVFLFLFLFSTYLLNAQRVGDPPLNVVNNPGYNWKNGRFDSSLTFPKDTFKIVPNQNAIAFKNKIPYFFNGTSWKKFGPENDTSIKQATFLAASKQLNLISNFGPTITANLNTLASNIELKDSTLLLRSLIATKASSSQLIDSTISLRAAINTKASSSQLIDSTISLRAAINTKASSSQLMDSTNSLRTAINTKASSLQLMDSTISLRTAINTKASSLQLMDSTISLRAAIDTKATSLQLMDSTNSLRATINTKQTLLAAGNNINIFDNVISSSDAFPLIGNDNDSIMVTPNALNFVRSSLVFRNPQKLNLPAISFGTENNGYYNDESLGLGISNVLTNTILWEAYPKGYNETVAVGAKVDKWRTSIGSTGYNNERAINSVYALENGSLGDITKPYIGHRTESNFYGDFEPHLVAVQSMVHDVASLSNLTNTTNEISHFVRVALSDIFAWQINDGTLTNNLSPNGSTVVTCPSGGFWVKCGTNGVPPFSETRALTYNIPHKTSWGFKMERMKEWELYLKSDGQRQIKGLRLDPERLEVNTRIFSFGSPELGLGIGTTSPHPTLTIQNNIDNVTFDAIPGTGQTSFGTNFTFTRPFFLNPVNQIYNQYSGWFVTDATKNSGYIFQTNTGKTILHATGKQRVAIGETSIPEATLHITKGSSDTDINVIIAKVPVYASIAAAQADPNLKTYSWYRIAEQLFIKLPTAL
jgi:hypothetical protein